VVRSVLLNAIQDSADSLDETCFVLDCIQGSVLMDNIRPLLVGYGVAESLKTLADDPHSDQGFAASLTIALLAAPLTNEKTKERLFSNPANQSNYGNQLWEAYYTGLQKVTAQLRWHPMISIILEKVVEILDSFATTARRTYTTTPGYFGDCRMFLTAFCSLAAQRSNWESLKRLKAHHIVMELIRSRRVDLLDDCASTLEQAIRAIWTLSFEPEMRSELVSLGIIDLLRGITPKTTEQTISQLIDATLFSFTSDTINHVITKSPSFPGTTRVMMSYCWYERPLIEQLTNNLKSYGIFAFEDVEPGASETVTTMMNAVPETMATAIERSKAMIVGLSHIYLEIPWCRMELEYAMKIKKHVILLVLEDRLDLEQWVGDLSNIQHDLITLRFQDKYVKKNRKEKKKDPKQQFAVFEAALSIANLLNVGM